MLTNITFTAQQQANLVVQAKAGLLKIASASNGLLGTVKAEGVTAGTVVSWSLQDNPGSAITIAAKNGDPTQADISFSQVPVRTEPYLMIVQASTQDGKTVQIPLAVVVREAFSIREVTRLTDAEFTVTGHTYDPTFASLTFKGIGPIGEVPGVRFMTPSDMPSGLNFYVDGDDTAYLQVNPATLEDPSGGMKVGTGLYALTLQAYREGTLYDSPDSPATVKVNLDLTSGPATGTLAFEAGASYDTTERGVLMEAMLAYKNGQAQVHTMEWLVSGGAVGSWATVPGAATLSALWKPAGATVQDVTFTVNVKNQGGTVVATSTLGPFKLCGKDPLAAPADNWSTTAAVPVRLFPAKLYPQSTGKKVYFRLALPDLQAGETATVTINPVAVGAAPAIVDPPTPVILTGGATTDAVVGFSIPDNASLYDMWRVVVSAAVTGGSSPRSGFGQLLAFSSGQTPLITQIADDSLTGNTGSYLSPTTIRAYQWVQDALPASPEDTFLNPAAGSWNSTLTEVSGATFLVRSAPAGITPVFQVGSGLYQLTGLLEADGNLSFGVLTTKSGMSTSPVVPVSLLAQKSVSRIRFTDFTTTNPVVSGGQGFSLTWGYDGSGSIYMQKANALPPDNVTGSLSASLSPITTSTVYVLRGSNALGEAFSAPVLVQFGSTGSSTQLPPSPAIAVIDEANHLTVAWQPSMINGSFTAYHHWVLSMKDAPAGVAYALSRPGVPTNPTWVDGLSFGGTQDARRFEIDLPSAGYHELSMQAFADSGQSLILNSKPWDSYKSFPAVRSVTLDKSTASKGEAIAITLGAADLGTGTSGDRWQAVYSDGTTSDWFPMTITSVAKAFTVGGQSQTIKVVVESDCSTSLPPVKLRRTVTTSVFIQDQDYQGTTDLFDQSTATIGVGGEVGFEITNNTDGSKAPSPYLVVVPALVRDDLTNELKLMVATARGRDASSVLGTMAIDVFPLPGRPHTLDLVKAPGDFLTSDGVIYDPVKITQDALPDVIVGRNMTPGRLQATGGKRPYRWFATDLPFGLSLAVDGTLTGTIMRLGRFPINVSVQDAQNPSSIDNKILYLNAKSDLAVKTTSVPNAKVGVAYEKELEAQYGVQPYTWDLMAGDLPHGLSLGLDGRITGWPVTYHEDDFSAYTFVAQVTDAVGAKASRQFQMSLSPMDLTVMPPDQPTILQGMGFTLRFPVVGGKPGYTLVGNPVAPAGFTASAKVVNGAVELIVSGGFSTSSTSINVSFRVRDAAGTEVPCDHTFQVAPAIPVTHWSAPQPPARVDSTSAAQIIPTAGTVSGTSFETVEIIPTLTNLTGTADTPGGQVKVQPPVTQGINEEATFRITLKQGAITLGKSSREYSIQTLAGTTTKDWTVRALPLRVGEFFTLDPFAPAFNAATPAELGINRLRIKEGSSLPVGVSLDQVTGHLYGVLRSTMVRSTLELVDPADTVLSTIAVDWTAVASSISIVGTLPQVDVGQSLDAALSVSGAGPNPVVELIHGRLPEGLTLGYSNSTVTLQGRARETGYFDLFIRVRDSLNQSGLYYSRLVVAYLPYLAVLTPSVPKITSGFAYTFKLRATGGKTPYTWALASGSTLPTGITLATDGTLSGTSTQDTFNQPVTFEVTDSYGQVASSALNVAVGTPDPLVVTTTSLPSGVVGATYIGVQLQATGGVPPYNWTQVTLPAGLSLDSATGLITGTPTAAFDQDISFQVKDALDVAASKTLRLTIQAATGFRITTGTIPNGQVGQVFNAGSGGSAPSWMGTTTAPNQMRWGGQLTRFRNGGKSYLLGVGGLGSVNNGVSEMPLFDPDVVVNGVRKGAWTAHTSINLRVLSNPASSLLMSTKNLWARAFAPVVPISDDEFVVIGGARINPMDIVSFDGTAHKGRTYHTSRELNTAGTYEHFTPIVFAKHSEAHSTTNGTVNALLLSAGPDLPSLGGIGIHGAAATKLQDGRILFLGGISMDLQTVQTGGADTGIREIFKAYDPKSVYIMQLATNRAQSTVTKVASLPVGLTCAQAVTLADGRVLVLGGLVTTMGQNATVTAPTDATYIYNPVTNAWTTGPKMPTKDYTHAAVVLKDGRVVYGGHRDDSGEVHTGFYVLDPNATTWVELLPEAANGVPLPNGWGAMALVDDGTMVFMGGHHHATMLSRFFVPNAEIWSVGSPTGTTTMEELYAYLERVNSYFDKVLEMPHTGNISGAYFITGGSTNGGATGFKLEATGGVLPYNTWSFSPAINGMAIDPLTGVFGGTPTDGFDGPVTFSVKDSTAPAASGPLTATKSLRVTIIDPQAPIWVTTAVTKGYLEENYQFQLVAKDTAGTTLTGNFSISPNSAFGLPPGITLSTSGVISGKTSTGWSKKITFRITHPANPTRFSDKEFLVEFVCHTRVGTTSLPVVTPGVAYSKTLQVLGGKAPYVWSISSLPTGLSLNSSTGVISGTCTETVDRDLTVQISVTDPNGCVGSAERTFQVRTAAWTIGPTPMTAIRGNNFSQALQVSGGNGNYTYSVQGLPTGFSYSSTTGTITSSNVTAAVGDYPLNVTVSDSTGASDSATLILKVQDPTYIWQSGGQDKTTAWAQSIYQHPNPIPIALSWGRNFSSEEGRFPGDASAGGFYRGEPWTVVITGIKSTNPTLTLGNACGVRWVADLWDLARQEPNGQETRFFYVHIHIDDVRNYQEPSGNFEIAATLNDGGTVATARLLVIREPRLGSLLPAREFWTDANGVAPPFHYSDYVSKG